ncbi:helicase associated domain-containing protein [Streptomyces sp. B27]|uniref:helicase associated domain-containing protein n=1 Tax=Streptomyces sp. B27 TaxID=2485015 RepID=UPI001F0CA595|nr:helicase associated domain-containing protein [Streptomyces sp. B27]
MDWSPNESVWADFLAACDRHTRAHGHLRVRVDYVDDEEFKLGAKMAHYRRLARRGELPPERREALDARGMVWELATGRQSIGQQPDRRVNRV